MVRPTARLEPVKSKRPAGRGAASARQQAEKAPCTVVRFGINSDRPVYHRSSATLHVIVCATQGIGF
jgi:hypothetical protein